MTDAGGSESWSFDVADRIHKEQRTTSSITKSTTYIDLDLAGNITSIVYQTGRTVNYSYDAARSTEQRHRWFQRRHICHRLEKSAERLLLKCRMLHAAGKLLRCVYRSELYIHGPRLLTHSYNNRLQPQEFTASSSAGNAIDISYSFVDPTTQKNAGIVNSITNNLDSTRSQTFSYDQLNRISAAQTGSTYSASPPHCWEVYGSDAWGNLQSITDPRTIRNTMAAPRKVDSRNPLVATMSFRVSHMMPRGTPLVTVASPMPGTRKAS